MLDKIDHRIHVSEEGTPTIQLGCGGVIISDNYAKDGKHAGVSFTLGEGEIGQDHNYLHGKTDQRYRQIGKITKLDQERAIMKKESLTCLECHGTADTCGCGDVSESAVLPCSIAWKSIKDGRPVNVMQQQEIKLTFESMTALIQGKKLHVTDGDNHFVFLPPTDGVFVTHEQLAQMRHQDQLGILNLLKDIGEYQQE